ncbi:hypothetical protein DAEQUDRAFT_86992 [Daedalea quercina L-15889]|uniref:Secreted protein n=1 Tax=Daedalea quercina L-15889 TaxID=1314783 RepID=A0A165KZC6_9APHY|nr:hypothetical protein DAEQUDRAFT_86992 [Daedalea quercina L-15889]
MKFAMLSSFLVLFAPESAGRHAASCDSTLSARGRFPSLLWVFTSFATAGTMHAHHERACSGFLCLSVLGRRHVSALSSAQWGGPSRSLRPQIPRLSKCEMHECEAVSTCQATRLAGQVCDWDVLSVPVRYGHTPTSSLGALAPALAPHDLRI